MKVVLDGARVDLRHADLLGVGGEGQVFLHKGLALKVFHDVHQASSKIARLKAFPNGLPKEVVAPARILEDLKGEPIGYAMPAVSGAREVGQLSRKKFREGVISNGAVLDLFKHIRRVLGALHSAKVIVGDLNDGNILFTGEHPWFIDVDSMQVPGHPCLVGHERFLDPQIYGIDLSRGGVFSPKTDWYAFSVMLFQSLLYVHPFGGVHKKYPTMLRRAEARVSVFSKKVKYPKAATHFQVLPESMLEHLQAVFEKDVRVEFPAHLLELSWSKCKCGLEHARERCPHCQVRKVVVSELPALAKEVTGGLRVVRVFSTLGRIVGARVGPGLEYVAEEDGEVKREDGSVVMRGALQSGMRFVPCGEDTFIAKERKLVCVRRGRVVQSTQTATLFGEPVFDVGAGALYRTQGDWLINEHTGERVGDVLSGQTWFRTGERFGLGFYRAGRSTIYFLFQRSRPGFINIDLPPIHGRLVFVDAVFDSGCALLSLCTEEAGRLMSRLYLISDRGGVIAAREGALEDDRVLALSARPGKCLAYGRLIASTDEGLLSVHIDKDKKRLLEGTLFTDTEPFVGAGDELLPGPGGSVYVVGTNTITQLQLG